MEEKKKLKIWLQYLYWNTNPAQNSAYSIAIPPSPPAAEHVST